MVSIVNRLHGDMVEVMFGKPFNPERGHGEALVVFAEGIEDFDLVMDDQGMIEGIRGNAKDYIQFLKDRKVSPKVIDGVRRALDDSKRAVRQRMRGR